MRAREFFAFMQERENVRLRKEAGDFFPWTDDPILQAYKFTNIRRHHDKTSRVLREKFYNPNFNADPKDILMNCALFRYFGTSQFAECVGWQSYETFDFDGIKAKAYDRLCRHERVFTGAYVITNQGLSEPKQEVVVDYFLKALHERTPALIKTLIATNSWERVGREMMQINGFGGSGFMTKEVLLDTTYCNFWAIRSTTVEDGSFTYPADWWSWTPIGPGARRGVGRVLYEDFTVKEVTVSEYRAFEVIMELVRISQNEEFWPVSFGPLAPHDIQFQLCEFDKYERVRLGQGRPRSRYKP